MRTVSYKCDRCGKPMTGRTAVKIAINLQRGVDPTEKISHDFCQKCFVKVKKGFALLLSDTEFPKMPVDNRETAPASVPEPENKASIKSASVTETPVKSEVHGGYHAEVTGPVVKEGSNCHFAVESMVPKAKPEPEPEQKDEGVSSDKSQKDEGLITGPLSKEEHALILKLYVEEGLDAESIAKRMRRLPRGVKRCINSAVKTGELNKLKYEFSIRKEEPAPVPEAVEDEEPESSAGSGVSNSSIVKDSYTAPPQTEVVDGKRHDIGAILALARAGWKPKDIASEKHYDEDVVRMLLEKYM